MQATMQATMQVEQLVAALFGEMTRDELQQKLEIGNRDYFRISCINISLKLGMIEMSIPDKPKSPSQKYRLTEKGEKLQEKLKKEH